jgi:hypothetical protein
LLLHAKASFSVPRTTCDTCDAGVINAGFLLHTAGQAVLDVALRCRRWLYVHEISSRTRASAAALSPGSRGSEACASGSRPRQRAYNNRHPQAARSPQGWLLSTALPLLLSTLLRVLLIAMSAGGAVLLTTAPLALHQLHAHAQFCTVPIACSSNQAGIPPTQSSLSGAECDAARPAGAGAVGTTNGFGSRRHLGTAEGFLTPKASSSNPALQEGLLGVALRAAMAPLWQPPIPSLALPNCSSRHCSRYSIRCGGNRSSDSGLGNDSYGAGRMVPDWCGSPRALQPASTAGETLPPPAWLPAVYGHVQRVYWGVGLLRYWQPSQVKIARERVVGACFGMWALQNSVLRHVRFWFVVTCNEVSLRYCLVFGQACTQSGIGVRGWPRLAMTPHCRSLHT